MIEFTISDKEAGMNVRKYASKLLPSASKGLLYKFIRNKNIELNHSRCKGGEILKAGDRIELFLSDETYESLRSVSVRTTVKTLDSSRILYEDEDYLFYDKPAGLLTQSDDSKKISLNDMLIEYVGVTGVFRPSICNRLDMNTSGIVLCGKSLEGLRSLSKMLSDSDSPKRKYYTAIVSGLIDESMELISYHRLEKNNTVKISDEYKSGSKKIITRIRPLKSNGKITCIEAGLVTGRKHQIRAQLSFIGHPIIGDPKYGSKTQSYGASRQMLHAGKVILPENILGGMEINAPIPYDMEKIIKEI